MNSNDRYKKVFIDSLSINSNDFSEDIKYNDIPEWDSIGHMTLMSGLEEEFNISLETDDIVDFSSFKKGIEILNKYKVKTLHLVDVIDYELENRIRSAAKQCGVLISWHDNPNFLLNNSDVLSDFSNKKRHFMANFYKNQRKRFDILIDDDGNPKGGKWSFDDENRKKLPKST